MTDQPPYPRRYNWGSEWVVVEEPGAGSTPVARLGGAELDEDDLQCGGDLEAWDASAGAWRRWRASEGTWRPADE